LRLGSQVVYSQTGRNKEKLEAGIREAAGGPANPSLPAQLVYPLVEVEGSPVEASVEA
jgi:hypothetical protein